MIRQRAADVVYAFCIAPADRQRVDECRAEIEHINARLLADPYLDYESIEALAAEIASQAHKIVEVTKGKTEWKA